MFAVFDTETAFPSPRHPYLITGHVMTEPKRIRVTPGLAATFADAQDIDPAFDRLYLSAAALRALVNEWRVFAANSANDRGKHCGESADELEKLIEGSE